MVDTLRSASLVRIVTLGSPKAFENSERTSSLVFFDCVLSTSSAKIGGTMWYPLPLLSAALMSTKCLHVVDGLCASLRFDNVAICFRH